LAALWVDDEETTGEFIAKHGLTFPLGHSADARAVAGLTGAFVNEDPLYLQSTGPVISRLPSDQEAIRLWDHVAGLASFPGFAELKRSLRERPQLRSLGVNPGETGIQEDWHGGSRRLKK
jgi:hypothetical protein